MISTPHQAKFIAHKLNSYANDDVAKLAGVFFDAQIDPNPHQIDAALFALNKPFLKGTIMADEVGLGKTIEAGIVIAQYWAEHKRSILIVVPSSLRQQWKQELLDRFNLNSTIVDSAYARKYKSKEHHSPFTKKGIYICSYDFAHRYNNEAIANGWDLLICDEAHKLRNYYKSSKNAVSVSIANLVKFSNKVLLLTATPLQNRLEELYGLVSIIDPTYFYSLEVFKERYIKGKSEYSLNNLRERLKKITKRTLRNQTNVQYTERNAITIQFEPTSDESQLYHLIDNYLAREDLFAFAKSQRHLTTLIIRKRLGSSTYAVASTLENIVNRMQAELSQGYKRDNRGGLISIGEDIDLTDEELEEYDKYSSESRAQEVIAKTKQEEIAFQEEIKELKSYAKFAASIKTNAKAENLIKAIEVGFEKLKPGAAKKTIVFTESTKTQEYLTDVLNRDGRYKYVTFNGSNNDAKSNELYREWKAANANSDLITGVETVDRRRAIIDKFKNDDTQVMIATEAAAEGINLQFCSMLINYDLPWNPQRVEQRIGRVHRYGQKHDVVVVNFSNQGNIAEQRILELLNDKFNLFSGVFGASNEVLGAIEDGLDFEQTVSEILNECRTTEEINSRFDELLRQNKEEIDSQQKKAKAQVLDNLDPDVQDRFNEYGKESEEAFNKFERMLIDLTKYELGNNATFSKDNHIFELLDNDYGAINGKYFFKLKDENRPHNARQYRYSDKLATSLRKRAITHVTRPAKLTLSIESTERPSSIAKKYLGRYGEMTVLNVTFGQGDNNDLTESYIIATGKCENGELIDTEVCSKILDLACISTVDTNIGKSLEIQQAVNDEISQKQEEVTERNASHYFDEKDRVEQSMKDKLTELDMKINKIDAQIVELQKSMRQIVFATKRLDVEKKIQTLRQKQRPLKREMFELEEDKDSLINKKLIKVDNILKGEPDIQELFTIKWQIV